MKASGIDALFHDPAAAVVLPYLEGRPTTPLAGSALARRAEGPTTADP